MTYSSEQERWAARIVAQARYLISPLPKEDQLKILELVCLRLTGGTPSQFRIALRELSKGRAAAGLDDATG